MAETLSFSGSQGTFNCDPDRAWFTITKRGILGQTNRLNYTRVTWDIHSSVNAPLGLTSAASKLAVDVRVAELEAKLVSGMDIVFSLGSTQQLISSFTTAGVQIASFSWLPGYDGVRGSGAEGLLRRTFHLVVYGDFKITTDTQITSWSETFRNVGFGGPIVVPVGSLGGFVQAQQVQAVTEYHNVQSGYATGLFDYPVAPNPIFFSNSLFYYDPRSFSVEKFTPRKWGKTSTRSSEGGIRWSYRSWSATSAYGTNPSQFI